MILSAPDRDAVRRFNGHWYLAFTIYREARGESLEARAAVGHSILNRVARPGWWGQDIETVVTKRWQYSSLTDPNDPQLSRVWPLSSERAWLECWEIARLLLNDPGKIPNPVPGADSYHDVSIPPPAWARSARHVAQIGRLLFYDVDKDWETTNARP